MRVICPTCGLAAPARPLSEPVGTWCEILAHTSVTGAACKGEGDVAIIPGSVRARRRR